MTAAGTDTETAAVTRVVHTAGQMAENLDLLTSTLYDVLSDRITDLQGDQPMLDLMRLSIEDNLRTVIHAVRTGITMDAVDAPPAAVEYARRLAQRGISANALLRAYRLGQELALDWIFDQIAENEPDPHVAYRAGQLFMATTFRYIDAVAEQLVGVYEDERERWLANRNTMRAAVLADLLAGAPVDAAAAERALGYRLHQQHLGVVLWDEHAGGDLRDLEKLLGQAARILDAAGQPLFVPRDRATGWAWLPLGRGAADSAGQLTDDRAEELRGLVGDRLLLALGTVGSGEEGFRRTHADALRAQQVALVAGDRRHSVISFADSRVRAASLLAADLPATRRLVADALGDLAVDTENASRLRTTLRAFLESRNSYAATAAQIHLHKNTVKYRVDKAVAARGRSLDEDRLDLELALVATYWLGSPVLAPA